MLQWDREEDTIPNGIGLPPYGCLPIFCPGGTAAYMLLIKMVLPRMGSRYYVGLYRYTVPIRTGYPTRWFYYIFLRWDHADHYLPWSLVTMIAWSPYAVNAVTAYLSITIF